MSSTFISCTQKPIVSQQFKSTTSHYHKYIDLTLKGKTAAASILFDKTMVKLIEQDDMCNLSRLYTSKYILNLPKKNKTTLAKAGEFAKLDSCPNEQNIFNFLSGNSYQKETLEQPYKTYAMYKSNNDIKPLISLAEKGSLSPFAKSRLYRFISKQIMKTDINKAEKYLLEAKRIDSYNGWVAAVQKDLVLYLNICSAQQKDCTHIEKRIQLTNSILHKN